MIDMLPLKYLKEKAEYIRYVSNLTARRRATFFRLNLFVKIDRAGDPDDEIAQQSFLQAFKNGLWIKEGV